MEPILEERLKKWHDQVKVLHEMETTFFQMEASEDPLYADLYAKVEGKSIEDRKTQVHRSKEWKDFSRGLAILKADVNKERRLLELKIKAYESEYLRFKMEGKVTSHPQWSDTVLLSTGAQRK